MSGSVQGKATHFDDRYLHVELQDERIISTPMDWYPELREAMMSQLKDYDEGELRGILARGEDSHHQFKGDFSHVDGLAAELIAFANTGGGELFIGVRDDGEVSGLTRADVARLNQLLSNAASQGVRPPLNLCSINVQTSQGLVMVVFEELLVNALVHRDYFISAPIRLLIFSDRIEIISPGHLPNHLDTEQIRFGLSNLRNPALAFHAFYMLPYRGLGSGIPRAMAAWSAIELGDDRRGNQFRVVIRRGE